MAARGRNILELGTGTGETAVRILARNSGARWTGIDASEAMLESARERLPDADLRLQRLEDPLPEGLFDLVVSVLAVHHLDGPKKRDLFRRVAEVSDSFVLGDLVVAERPEDALIAIDWVMDLPSTVSEQVEWLEEAGFEVRRVTFGRIWRYSSLERQPASAPPSSQPQGPVGGFECDVSMHRVAIRRRRLRVSPARETATRADGSACSVAKRRAGVTSRALRRKAPKTGAFLVIRERVTRSPRARRRLCRQRPRAPRRAARGLGSRAA